MALTTRDALAIAVVIISLGAAIAGLVIAGGYVAHSGPPNLHPRICVKGHDVLKDTHTHHLCDVWTQVSPVPDPMPS